MLDYRALTFLTLYEQMNYRRTAEKLNMTQPGVTQHIHYLESYYGVKLFAYNGRLLTRTKQAEQLKQYFESVLAEDGQIDIMKLKPISFDPVHNGYHVIGDKVGNAFSDGKELDK